MYSKEPSQWEGQFEQQKQMLKLMDKKLFEILRSKCFFPKCLKCRWLLDFIFIIEEMLQNTCYIFSTFHVVVIFWIFHEYIFFALFVLISLKCHYIHVCYAYRIIVKDKTLDIDRYFQILSHCCIKSLFHFSHWFSSIYSVLDKSVLRALSVLIITTYLFSSI